MPVCDATSLLCEALARELHNTSAQVEQLAATLAADGELLSRFLPQLQSFDLIAQRVGQGALLMERLAQGMDPNIALAQVGLEQMQERLRTALDAHPQLAG